ncbi:hypothetical protein SDC9_154127 [bioreactor metagenome]|uniref:Uncharacterized protein n=1 Tax=bioreactor metagenome TaxID=1076179 RepID=A0A645EZG1_9ZZZZ
MHHGGCGFSQQHAGLGQAELLTFVREELYLIPLLQKADVLGHRRLRDMQLFCGFGEVKQAASG